MTAVALAPTAGILYQAFTTGGLPLNAGLLYTYAAGGTTPQATYTTSAGTVQNANPIVLGADGRPPSEVWLVQGSTYRFDLKTSAGSLIASFDNISGINDLVQLALTFLPLAGGTLTGPVVFSNPQPATDLLTSICDGRLTLTTGVPVTTSDVTAAGTLFFTPYKGNRIALFSAGGHWLIYNFTEVSLTLTLTSGKPYDIFCFDSSGTVTLEALVWTNDTTRATALTTQNGVLVKTGATTRRYLGTIYASGANTTEDSFAKRYVWNYYNRQARPMRRVDTTDSWAYSTASYQQANASAANQLDYIQGVSEEPIFARVQAHCSPSTSGTFRNVYVGIGVDSATVNSAQIMGQGSSNSSFNCEPIAEYRAYPGAGRHTLVWLEYGAGTDTQTWFGDNGATLLQSGITGQING